MAEIVGIDPDPFSHVVMINKGSVDGTFLGQAIVDAHGVMGQVIEVTPVSSRVMLVTDSSSRVPVQNNRTGYRAIAAGTGNPDQLELLHIPDTADFKEGDLLTSSGLGQRYPAGYPLGKVKQVIHKPGQPFAVVHVQPVAEVNRSRLVLLVFRDKNDMADYSGGQPSMSVQPSNAHWVVLDVTVSCSGSEYCAIARVVIGGKTSLGTDGGDVLDSGTT